MLDEDLEALADIEQRWAGASKPLDILPNGAVIDGNGSLAYRIVYASEADRKALLMASRDIAKLLEIVRRCVTAKKE